MTIAVDMGRKATKTNKQTLLDNVAKCSRNEPAHNFGSKTKAMPTYPAGLEV